MSLLALAHRYVAAAEPRSGRTAWLLYGRRLDRELWLITDTSALAFIDADDPRPVVLGDELPRLRGLDDAALGHVLDAKAVFGRATRVVDPQPAEAS